MPRRFKRFFHFHRIRWQFTGDQHHTTRDNEFNLSAFSSHDSTMEEENVRQTRHRQGFTRPHHGSQLGILWDGGQRGVVAGTNVLPQGCPHHNTNFTIR